MRKLIAVMGVSILVAASTTGCGRSSACEQALSFAKDSAETLASASNRQKRELADIEARFQSGEIGYVKYSDEQEGWRQWLLDFSKEFDDDMALVSTECGTDGMQEMLEYGLQIANRN